MQVHGVGSIPSTPPSLASRASDGAGAVASVGNAALATELSDVVAREAARAFNHNHNLYDTAIDAVYNQTHVGGSAFHHIVDGNHTLWGALRAAHQARPDDSFLSAAGGALEHLARDTCSVSGIPFFTMKMDTLRGLADTLGVSTRYLGDMLTFNAPEVLGAGLGVIPLALGWKKLECERLAEMATTMTAAAALSANPLLLGVGLVATGKALARLRQDGSIGRALRGIGRGAVTTGVAVAVSTFVPGPALLGAALGIGAALAARHGYNKLIASPPRLGSTGGG